MTGCHVGVIGLAVMGQNLVLNLAENGFSVAVFNRTYATAESFAATSPDWATIHASANLEDFVASIERPRRIILLLRAGQPVDEMTRRLAALLDAGDVVVDAGNSAHADYARRHAVLSEAGAAYVGAGVSGGEEGARYGPSIMPGGDAAAWPLLEPMFTAIAAKFQSDEDANEEACTSWIGPGGSGHFVKMVHNGIEYGDMQVLAEAVALMKDAGLEAARIAETLQRWNDGRLQSFLVEITASILTRLDDHGDGLLLPKILDAAGQKGTGRWTAVEALEHAVPLTLISEAVTARTLSSRRDLRVAAESILDGPVPQPAVDPELLVEQLEAAVWASKVISYAQGFDLLAAASAENDWNLDFGEIARIWRAGCIIRAEMLDQIAAAFDASEVPGHLLLAPTFSAPMSEAQVGLRATVAAATAAGVPVPAMSSALAFYDGLRRANGSANLIQAQRDWFGAHTYERLDRPRGEFFHTDWVGSGAKAISGSYRA